MFLTFCFEIILVAGFFTIATFLNLEVYFKKINGPIFGKAHLEVLDLFKKIS